MDVNRRIVYHVSVASAVLNFHSGAASREKVMERLSIPAGKFNSRALLARDRKRLQKSDQKDSVRAKLFT